MNATDEQLETLTEAFRSIQGLSDVEKRKVWLVLAAKNYNEARALVWGYDPAEVLRELLTQAGQAGPSGTITAFKAKLAMHGVNQPDDDVMRRLVMNYSKQLEQASDQAADPYIAKLLYDAAKQCPGTTTRSKIVDQLHISLNGTWMDQHPLLRNGVDLLTGRPVVLKFLSTDVAEQTKMTRAELHAAKLLNLGKPEAPLVAIEVVQVEVHESDQTTRSIGHGLRMALKMDWFVGSLVSLPQLSEALICRGGRRIQTALEFMHSKELTHMDVKPANILVDHRGDWFLSDFGSSTPFGEQAWSFTQGWYPGGISRHAPVSAAIDWGLLFVTLVALWKKDNWCELMDDTSASIVLSKVVARSLEIQDTDLVSLMRDVRDLAGWSEMAT